MATNALQRLLGYGRDVAQGASNAVASNISAPVDLIAWGLRKVGVPIGEAVGGSDWMARQGLTRQPQNALAGLAGEALGMTGPMVAAAKAPQIANALRQMEANAAAPQTLGSQRGAIVYHGSPHKFDAFDSSKIGTGEGAQAYGHGLYLAESPAVAQTYKDLNPTALSSPIRAFRGTELTPGTPEYHAATLVDGMGLQQARKQVANWIANARPEMAREAEGWAKTLETLNAATSKADFKQLKNKGNLYKVDLPDDKIAKMLDWDKPLSQQAPEIQDIFAGAAKHLGIDDPMSLTGRDAYRRMHEAAIRKGKPEPAAIKEAQMVRGLRQAGIPGIRYLDGGSRGAGQGTSNFVVFPGEENALKILERK